jgi:serine/threonine-protein kinase RsbW
MRTHDAVLSLEIPAEAEQISLVRTQVANHARFLAFGEEEVFDLTLAVGEACSNAVRYGGVGYDAPCVTITCLLSAPGRLQVDIRNQGNGFHPQVADLAALPDPSDYATQGRGFALMTALMDDVEVLSDGRNTIVRLTKLAATH